VTPQRITLSRAVAKIWRGRPPSGKFIMHGVPRDHWCEHHGAVTKWHQCKMHLPIEKWPKIVRVW